MNKTLQTQTSDHEQIIVSRQFAGPIPLPESLEKYERLLPGAAERILQMAENEATARIYKEKNQTDNESLLTKNIIRSSYLGIFFAFATVLLLAALAYYALKKGFPGVAGSIIAAMASIAGIFILFRNRKAKNRLKK